jgi:hypothetical protein
MEKLKFGYFNYSWSVTIEDLKLVALVQLQSS